MSHEAAGYDLYSCEDMILEPRTHKLVNTHISVATPGTRMYARIPPRSGLSIKGWDIGAGVVDFYYREAIKVLLINNSDTLFPINTGDCILELILEHSETQNAS